MAFISPDVAVALVKGYAGDLRGQGDRGIRINRGTMGSSPSSPPQAKRESDTVVNNRYLYGFIFIVVYIVRLFATRFYYYHPV